MPITRAKAASLLNQKEMALYDDSRVNTLRKLDAKALGVRIGRARTARDRARDLLQRQKLASRARTGSKRGASGLANQRSKDKAALLADILSRFEDQLRQVERTERKAAKAAAKAAPAGRKGAAKVAKRSAGKAASRAGSGAKKAATKKAAAKKSTARKSTAKKSAAGKSAAKKKAAKKALTPAQALRRTRELLKAKQERDRQPKSWEAAGQVDGHAGQAGFQSTGAAMRAEQLHAAEARIPAIQGSVSTRDRINQGKRDHRRAPGGED